MPLALEITIKTHDDVHGHRRVLESKGMKLSKGKPTEGKRTNTANKFDLNAVMSRLLSIPYTDGNLGVILFHIMHSPGQSRTIPDPSLDLHHRIRDMRPSCPCLSSCQLVSEFPPLRG